MQKDPADSACCVERDCAVRGEAWEGEHHFVNLAVAVTAHADKLFFASVQKFRGALGVPAFGERVPRAVVEIIAQKNDCVNFVFKGS